MIETLDLVQNERNRGDASPEIVILPSEGVETDNEDINDDLNEEISLSDIQEIAGTFEVNRSPDEVESEEEEAVNEGLTYQAIRRSVIDIINSNMPLHEKVNELLEQSLCDWCIGRNTGEFRIAPVNGLSHKSVENRRELCETNGGKSPVEYFELLFDTEFRIYLIEETLRYAHDKGHHQFSFEDVDLNMFVGTLFISGYNPFPQTKMYWDTKDDTTAYIIQNAISRNRYMEIKRYLHCTDNNHSDNMDKFAKVRPLYNLMNTKVNQFGYMHNHFSIVEQMVPYTECIVRNKRCTKNLFVLAIKTFG